jgi:hypothetical protein
MPKMQKDKGRKTVWKKKGKRTWVNDKDDERRGGIIAAIDCDEVVAWTASRQRTRWRRTVGGFDVGSIPVLLASPGGEIENDNQFAGRVRAKIDVAGHSPHGTSD